MLKDQVKKVPPLGGGIELCGGSSCLGSLRSLLNTVGILTLPMFLLSDRSLIWMWSASFARWCRVLLSLSIIDVHSATRKDQVNKLQEHLNSIDLHIKFTLELPGTDGLPFLDTLTKPTPNFIQSTVYRKPTHTDRYLDYNSNQTISAKLSVIHTLTHRAKQVCSTSELLAKEMDHLHKVLQDNHYPPQFCQQGKPKQKTYKKPNPSMEKFIEGARVVIPYIKGLSEQYRHTLAKYRVRVFFKGTSTIKSLLMHRKDPIPDAHKTDIIYHWKCPANNCTAEYIDETNRSLKERVSDHRNQTTSAITNHHISTKHP